MRGARHPGLTFHELAAEDLHKLPALGESEPFDYVILSGTLQQIYDFAHGAGADSGGVSRPHADHHLHVFAGVAAAGPAGGDAALEGARAG